MNNIVGLPKLDFVKVLVMALPNYRHLNKRMSPVSESWINYYSDIASNYNIRNLFLITFQNLVSLTRSVEDPSPARSLFASSIWFLISLTHSLALFSSFALNWNSRSLWLILTLYKWVYFRACYIYLKHRASIICKSAFTISKLIMPLALEFFSASDLK
jgi:hypothetical protein